MCLPFAPERVTAGARAMRGPGPLRLRFCIGHIHAPLRLETPHGNTPTSPR